MLIDPKFAKLDPWTMEILAGSGAKLSGPERLETGFYLCRHWNFYMLFADRNAWKLYPSDLGRELCSRELCSRELGSNIDAYGVCDSPEQFKRAVGDMLISSPRKFCVSFVRIDRDLSNKGKGGGWRWHKWGEYIGEQTPTTEYLDDEESIETVYTYHIYELVASER